MRGPCRGKEGLPYGNSHRSTPANTHTLSTQGLLFILYTHFLSRHPPTTATQSLITPPCVCILWGNALDRKVSARCVLISIKRAVETRAAPTPLIKWQGLGWQKHFRWLAVFSGKWTSHHWSLLKNNSANNSNSGSTIILINMLWSLIDFYCMISLW